MTLGGEPTRGGVAAQVRASAPDRAADAGSVPARPATDDGALATAPIDDLETAVYVARDLHGDQLGQVRRTLAQARSRMSDTTYRRALDLARDSVLLSIDECVKGALAMEWEPAPRPEFSLETIEAAVAEQERSADDDETRDPNA